MPEEDLKEFQEILAFEESLKPKEGQELSEIAKSFKMVVEIPGEIPSQTIQRVQRMKAQIDKIGYTFPGVTDEQLEVEFEPAEIEKPMMIVESVSSQGLITMAYNQKMFFPENTKMMNYSKIFEIKMISGKDGRITKAKQIADLVSEESNVEDHKRSLEKVHMCAAEKRLG